MAAMASAHHADVEFSAIPAAPLPISSAAGAHVLRDAAARSDAVLLDSIAAASTAPWIGRIPRPVIAVVHQPPGGMDTSRGRRWLQARLDRLAYRSTVGFIAASETLREALLTSGVPSRIVRVVPPGCDVPAGSGAGLDLRRGRTASLLCVANWLPRKGIMELLEAVARLPANAATLWLAGATDADRGYSRRVRRRLASADLVQRVVVRGTLPVEDVGALYAAADAFVLPSFVDPYGTAWAEAMAFGLPVVGWRAGYLPYLVADGREGLLIEPGDVAGLASALRAIVEDRRLRERLAAASRRRAASLPTWERAASLFFEAVRDLLPGTSVATGAVP
jgi:glycosyltransferase involved in cell wall biosynthesis